VPKKKAPKGPKAPSFQNGQVYIGDQLVSSTSKQGNNVVTRYNETPQQKQNRAYSQGRINQILPTLGKTPKAMSAQYDQIGKAYQDEQVANFNQQYDPQLRNLREDIAGRFGTLKATPFVDQLTTMEQTIRQPALASIGRNASLMKQDLFDRGEANKYKELEALGYQLSDSQQRFLTGLQGSGTQSAAGNNYAQQNFSNLFQNAQLAQQAQRGRSFWDKVSNPFGM
jgi:hypothetical protein